MLPITKKFRPKKFRLWRGAFLTAVALTLLAGTAPGAWAQKSKGKSSTSQPKVSTPRPSPPRSSPPRSSAPRTAPSRPSGSHTTGRVISTPSGGRSGISNSKPPTQARPAPAPGRIESRPPRTGTTSTPPSQDRKGSTDLPTTGFRTGPTPGARWEPSDDGNGGGSGSGGSGGGGGGGYYGGGHHGGHHGGHYYFGFGHYHPGYYGYYSPFPYYFGSYYYPYGPSYYLGLGYGYSPYYRSRYVRTEVLEPQGALDLNVKPKDTQVYLNGYYIGTVGDFDGWPRYLWLDEDVHELIFYKEGYETVVREIAVQPDAVVNVKLRMRPGVSEDPETLTRYRAEGRSNLSRRSRESYSDRGEARSDDRLYGDRQRSDDRRGYDEPRPERPAAESEDGRIEDGEIEITEVEMAKDSGRLFLTIAPAEASVYIDGRFVGVGGELTDLEVGLLMDTGEHEIQVFHPAFEAREKIFEVTAGQETRLGIDLSSDE